MMGIDSGEIQAIRWIYPILGLPQAKLDEFPPGRYILVSENTRIWRWFRGFLIPSFLMYKYEG